MVAALALSACSGGVQVGKEPTTTTTTLAPTTTAAPARPTTTMPAPRKAAATAAPKPTVPPTVPGQPLVVDPELLEPFLVNPSGWSKMDDGYFGTGPADLDKAAADEVEEGENPAEARKFLDDLGFLAGYSRAWLKTEGATDYSHLIVSMYFFSTPQGAAGYLKYDAAVFDEMTDGELERMDFGAVPGSRTWSGKSDEGHLIVVLFARDNFYVQVVLTRSTDRYGHAFGWARDTAVAQYEGLA